MRILLVNDYINPIGGTEVYMHNIKEELINRGHEAKIYGKNLSEKEIIKLKSKPSMKHYIQQIFNAHEYYNFKKVLKEFNPDVIHLNNILNELSPSILLAIDNIPVIMTVHDNRIVNAVSILSLRTGKECKDRTCGGCMNCVGLNGSFYEKFKRRLHKKLFKKISLYITPSNFMQELLLEAKFKPVIHIPNGFLLFKYAPITYYINLLYIGRLTKDKGVDYLIRALPFIKNKYPTVKLQIIGDGSERRNLQSLSKTLRVDENIDFIASLPHEDLLQYYQDSTIVVIPSIYDDNLPTVCIEAMSVGRPMVGTIKGGIPELIEDNVTGLLVEARNESKLAEAVNSLLSDKGRLQKMSEKASNKAKNYDIHLHIDKLDKIYNDLLKK